MEVVWVPVAWQWQTEPRQLGSCMYLLLIIFPWGSHVGWMPKTVWTRWAKRDSGNILEYSESEEWKDGRGRSELASDNLHAQAIHWPSMGTLSLFSVCVSLKR